MLKLIRTCSNLGGGGGGDREEGGLRSAIFGQERASKKGLIVPLLVLFSMCHSTVSPFFDVPPFWGSVSCIGTQFFRGFQGGSEAMGTLEVNACTQFSGVEALSGPPPPNGYPLFFFWGPARWRPRRREKKRGFLIEQIPPPKKKNIEQIPNKIIETIPRQSFNKSPNKSKSRFTPGPSLYSVWTPKSARKNRFFVFFGLGCSIGRCFGWGRCIGSFFGLGRCIGRCLVSGAVSGECLVWEAVSGVFLVWEDGIG